MSPFGDDRYSIITGGRRFWAMRKNGSINISAIVEKGELSKSEILIRQIIENAQREDLTPWEKAKAIDLLMKETGWNASQTASKLGFANSTVTKLLSLLSLPESIQEQLRAGELPATAAYDLSRVNDTAEQDKLAGRVASGELTRDDLSGVIKARRRNRHAKRNPARRSCRVTAKLENRQSVIVSAPALDLPSFVAILKTLLDHSQKALAEGMTLDALVKRLKSKPTNAEQAIEDG